MRQKVQLTSSFSGLAVDVVRVVTVTDQPEPPLAAVHQPVGAAGEEALALVALVVEVALLLVRHRLGPRLARVAPLQQGAAPAPEVARAAAAVGARPPVEARARRRGRESAARGLRALRHQLRLLAVQEAVAGVVVCVDVVAERVLVHGAAASVLGQLRAGCGKSPWLQLVAAQGETESEILASSARHLSSGTRRDFEPFQPSY